MPCASPSLPEMSRERRRGPVLRPRASAAAALCMHTGAAMDIVSCAPPNQTFNCADRASSMLTPRRKLGVVPYAKSRIAPRTLPPHLNQPSDLRHQPPLLLTLTLTLTHHRHHHLLSITITTLPPPTSSKPRCTPATSICQAYQPLLPHQGSFPLSPAHIIDSLFPRVFVG